MSWIVITIKVETSWDVVTIEIVTNQAVITIKVAKNQDVVVLGVAKIEITNRWNTTVIYMFSVHESCGCLSQQTCNV
jgi:hypothetical protein